MGYDVVIAGAGPTGLMLAGELSLAGASVLVLEERDGAERAIMTGAMGARSVNAPTAHAFHWRGLLPAVREAAIWWYDPESAGPGSPDEAKPRFVGHFSGIVIRYDRLDFGHPDFAAHRLGAGVISQSALETVLAERATALGAEVRWGRGLTGFTASADGVTVEAGGETIRAGWLAGCDGGRSRVRKLAGFAFPGAGPEFTGIQAMVEFDGPGAPPVGEWTPTPAGAYVHGPVHGRLHTVEYGRTADRDRPVTAAEIEDSLRRVAGIEVKIGAVPVATRYTDTARQATEYRRGRVLLAGDAAHVHSPFGGQGMNLGLADAMNLGWKLAAAVRGDGPPGLLDTYTAERHPVGDWVQRWTLAQTALGRTDPASRALREIVTDFLDTGPAATYVTTRISGAWQHYDLPGEHPLTGRMAPDVELADGTRLAEHAHDGRFLLLTDENSAQPAAHSRLTVVTARPPGVPALLVRPDGYVAWAADTADGADGAVAAVLGPSSSERAFAGGRDDHRPARPRG
ncbi:2-polyprenyl-6-methoxyphenol hydroxylase [Amycolatopsis xylanica]|uniref:2-polyprenyl-6-methoxyphenol hydroxylase n=1 Tax=Amycolatopsis xylanica TaxID=589385 RepID=A0A1H2VVF0_9PSEU|nr:FAD-dependent monooxygenase [Amycolatopsis xylanica]SDW71924.1 2-polyprenyl-6-methoxyphenol hydroxylase [Amycolatopsis xylanica]